MDPGAETQRARRARLANLRQELLAPVGAILGFGEMLHQDAARNGPVETASHGFRQGARGVAVRGTASRG